MPKIQYQKKNNCFIASIPKEVMTALGAKQGDTMHYNILRNGKAEVIIIKGDKNNEWFTNF